MMKNIVNVASTLIFSGLAATALAGGDDDPRIGMLTFDRIELRDGDGDPQVFEVEGWLGHDLNKVWFKSENEHADGSWAGTELQAGWRRAIAPHWDFKLGARRDYRPNPSRNWAVVGFEGTAPYGIDVDATLFIGESGRTGVRLKAEYELALTQRLMLVPDLEINAHGENDEATGTGSGLSDMSFGVRLMYGVTGRITPYAGVVWDRSFGNTSDFAMAAGEGNESTQVKIGIQVWF
ncbi:MAG: copper resistance protein B [Gammaproteobacteria bacterium]|nr:copper resistance protein B [Gammaproteobacteria bacterium]